MIYFKKIQLYNQQKRMNILENLEIVAIKKTFIDNQ